MSLWGNSDSIAQSNTATASVTVTAANATVVGINTEFATDFAVSQFLQVGQNDYIITSIANATVMTVGSATGGALVGASSNAVYNVSSKPIYITLTPNLDANDVYGVSEAEMLYANTADTEADSVAHAGWAHRIDKGNGRFYYETLVAGSSIAGDNDTDDGKLPE